jgi:hypothetical protein
LMANSNMFRITPERQNQHVLESKLLTGILRFHVCNRHREQHEKPSNNASNKSSCSSLHQRVESKILHPRLHNALTVFIE